MEERDRQLSDRMTTYLANFAKTGNPNQGGSPCGVRLPVWQPITAGQRKIMMFTNREDRMGCPNRWKLVHTMLTKPSVGE